MIPGAVEVEIIAGWGLYYRHEAVDIILCSQLYLLR